jgi:integrase/recombinase XerD
MQHLTTWTTYLRTEKGLAPRTILEYKKDLEQFNRFMLEQLKIWNWQEVSTIYIREFISKLENASPYRIHRVISALRSILGFLHKENIVTSNVAAQIGKPKLPQRLPKAMTPTEVSKMLEATLKHSRRAEKTRNWALIAFLYGSGLRISECLSLTLEEGSSLIRTDGIVTSVRVVGKGNKERIVPLSASAQTALQQWLRHRKLEGDLTNPYVWVNTSGRSKGKRMTAQGVDKIIRTAGLEAGLGGKSAHKLRHSFATALVNAETPIELVKDIMGHASIATTQIYVKASEKRLQTAVTALPDVTVMVHKQ